MKASVTTTYAYGESILKHDDEWPKMCGMGETERSQQMRLVLEEYKASGLSRREFCGQRSIPLTTFDYWRREHAG